MREIDAVIGRSFQSVDGLDDYPLFDVADLAAHDEDDDAFECWLATVSTTSFEQTLTGLLEAEDGTPSRFGLTA